MLITHLNLDLFPQGALSSISTIIDIGANKGDWTAGMLEFCEPDQVICIEPHPQLAAGLNRRFSKLKNITVIQAAISAFQGRGELNITSNQQLNSLLKPEKEMQQIFPNNFDIQERTEVDVFALDSITSDLEQISILKIDTQGSEKNVLLGAADTLKKTKFVLLEAGFQPHYEGEASFFELDRILNTNGFCISNYSRPKGGRLEARYADVLYVSKKLCSVV